MGSDQLTVQRSEAAHKRRIIKPGIKYHLRSKLRSYPGLETSIMKVWYPIKYSLWKTKWKLETLIGNQRWAMKRKIDINKTYLVSPKKIIYSSLKEFSLRDYKGHILSGDWDLLERRFDTLDIFHAIEQVCVDGKKWPETVFYQRLLDDINHGHLHYGCRNENELIHHCHDIELLFLNIQQNGYKSQSELFKTGYIKNPLVAEDEVVVSIGRDGDFLFSDGAHRLAIAKLLDIPEIPIKVSVRHKDWISFCDELSLYSKENKISKEGKLYQPITHLDLSDLPASHESDQRYQLIKDNTQIRQGKLLDLGASFGYFCHRFEELGLDCVAVENDPQTVYFLKRLARAENRKFQIVTDSVLDSTELQDQHYNIVLALNIFHHFLKTEEAYKRLIELINNLQMDELFFESHLQDESQMFGAYKNFSPEEFVEFILENSSLDKYILIGNMKDGRPIYKLFHQN